MERTNVWAKRAHSRDTRDSGDMKSENLKLTSLTWFAPYAIEEGEIRYRRYGRGPAIQEKNKYTPGGVRK